ncbi:MAG: hypothetical protein KatS3mg051_0769 [Anaerolineae bacterium]|nr:MAG: hypothetical protein KatS3mg051_0769 [Anaerolineae bacterium]
MVPEEERMKVPSPRVEREFRGEVKPQSRVSQTVIQGARQR